MAYRSINSVHLIAEYGESLGLSLTALLTGSGVTAEQLRDVTAQIEDHQELRVLENLTRLTDDAFLVGRALGGRYQLTSYGIWGYALLASPSLRKAIELGLRYLDLTYAFCHIHLQKVDGKARIVFEPKCSGDVARLVLFRDMWAMMVIQRDLFAGNFPVFQMSFSCEPPESIQDEQLSHFMSQMSGQLLFGQTQNYVEFEWQYLDMQLPRGSDVTVSMCEQQCQALLEEKQSMVGLSYDIRRLMLKHGMQISMAFVAQQLAMTSRTLHRQLAAQGTSWRVLRDYVRCAMAEELLATKTIKLDEIAERLGFSDAANFSHAFKRWRGISPARYREVGQFDGSK